MDGLILCIMSDHRWIAERLPAHVCSLVELVEKEGDRHASSQQ